LEAKDVFITVLAPYLLAGFGMSTEITEQVEVAKLPNGYEPFAETEPKQEPMGDAPKGRSHREAVAAARTAPKTAEVVSVINDPPNAPKKLGEGDKGQAAQPVKPAAAS
jgi:hypothetical protein